jgi:hypothetical protein
MAVNANMQGTGDKPQQPKRLPIAMLRMDMTALIVRMATLCCRITCTWGEHMSYHTYTSSRLPFQLKQVSWLSVKVAWSVKPHQKAIG